MSHGHGSLQIASCLTHPCRTNNASLIGGVHLNAASCSQLLLSDENLDFGPNLYRSMNALSSPWIRFGCRPSTALGESSERKAAAAEAGLVDWSYVADC